MRFDYKNISIGFLIGVICTIITVALIGDVEIETDFQFGDKATNKDISIIIEKEVNQDGEEIITVRFKDYGFFMPKDGAGRKAKIQGFLVHNTFEETNDAGQIIRTDSYEIVASAVELAKSEKF